MELLGLGIFLGVILGMAIASLYIINKECEKWRREAYAKYKSSIFKR